MTQMGEMSLRPAPRPRIYGNDSKCRTAVARYITRADELLDQATGVRRRIDSLGNDDSLRYEIAACAVEEEWVQAVRRWFRNTVRSLGLYLQDQLSDVLPTVAGGLPPETGKHPYRISLQNGEPWLSEAKTELQELQNVLGVRRDVVTQASVLVHFAELRASGLVAESVVTDHEKEMLNPRTPRELSNAIASAKELTEATLRAALDRLRQPYVRKDSLPNLMKKWREAIATLAPPDRQGQQDLDKAQAALANLIGFLAEWRNSYGRGHGRPQYPSGLRPRHAQLSVDAAQTAIRFIVITMDDMELLPPEDR